MRLVDALALSLFVVTLTSGQECPKDLIQENLNSYELYSDVRLCWKCVSTVEYLCQKYIRLESGGFSCDWGEQWLRNTPQCVAYSCIDGPGAMLSDDPRTSASRNPGSPSPSGTGASRAGFDANPLQPVDNFFANMRPSTDTSSSLDNDRYEFGRFDAVNRGEYKKLLMPMFAPTPGPVDCSAVELNTEGTGCKDGFLAEGRCYYLDTSEVRSYDSAKKRCERSAKGSPGYSGLAIIKSEETYNSILCHLIPLIQQLDTDNERSFIAWLGATFHDRIRWEDGEPEEKGGYASQWKKGYPVAISTYTKLGLFVEDDASLHGIVNREGPMEYYALCEYAPSDE